MRNLFELIPADMLEYSQVMKQYALFSDDQVEILVNNCIKAGVDEEYIPLYVATVAQAKLTDILIKRYIEGFLDVTYDEENNELNFEPIYDEQR